MQAAGAVASAGARITRGAAPRRKADGVLRRRMRDRIRPSRAPRVACTLAVVLLYGGAAAAADWRERVTFTLSDRARGEFVDWFRPPDGVAPVHAQRYGFFANQLRIGVRVVLPHVQLSLEVQDTRLANLPDEATLPPPQGALGPGALYFLNTPDSSQGETFLKQGFVTLRRRGFTATLGRFDYREGLETLPGDPTLAFLKRARIA
jgi:hypothetical protein